MYGNSPFRPAQKLIRITFVYVSFKPVSAEIPINSSYCFVNLCSVRGNINGFHNHYKPSQVGKYSFTVTCRSCKCSMMSESNYCLHDSQTHSKHYSTPVNNLWHFSQCISSITLFCVRRSQFFQVPRKLWQLYIRMINSLCLCKNVC